MRWVFITLTILSILSQIPHAYWAIDNFSTIKERWLKVSQNIVFCGIISVGILAFVLIGKHWYALAGAAIEIVINIYYYNSQFDKRTSRKKTWLAYFLAFLIPISIFIFSMEIK
jgi:hypothetical protein